MGIGNWVGIGTNKKREMILKFWPRVTVTKVMTLAEMGRLGDEDEERV